MEPLISEISRLLSDTLSPDQTLISSAAAGLDRLSHLPQFPFALLAVAAGGDNQGLRVAAATYLKNFTRSQMEGKSALPEVHTEFRNKLVEALLQVEPTVLKVLAEALRMIIVVDFVRENSWPNLVPELKSAIGNSDLIGQASYSHWSTFNALTVLQTLVKPFQYFLNPKMPKEPVPDQLEQIAKDILVPVLDLFHRLVDKALPCQDGPQVEIEQVILIICKCMYFTVRSYMPSALCPFLPSFVGDLSRILGSLSLTSAFSESGYLLRLKTAKRSLIIFCSLITRHKKHCDKLMPNIIATVVRIAKLSPHVTMLDSLPERIVSLAFDVISHVLETGRGWRLVSPHFSSLLESAIFPALTLNQKDISEWEEDTEEYLRKNLPSELDEISGWAEDLFTARKSAINTLGIIAMSKGPPVASAVSKRKKGDKNKRKELQSSVGELLVIPFLSKFPMPADKIEMSSRTVQDYYGVLMAYGGLQDFLNEQKPEYTSILVQHRVLPLYSFSHCSPHLLAAANWVLGTLSSCLPQDLSADVYNFLMKALTIPDVRDLNCFPVRASAVGAIAELLENDCTPSDWLSLLQVLVNRLNCGDDNECSLLFGILGTVVESGKEEVATHIPLIVSSISGVISKNIPPIPEPWPQVVERGFAALASISQIWENYTQDDVQLQEKADYNSSFAAVAGTFSSLLQSAWIASLELMEASVSTTLPPPSSVNDASHLLGFIMRSIKTMDDILGLKIRELLAVWACLIADWHAWEEMEDMAIFSAIQEAVNLNKQFDHANILMERFPSNYSSNSSTQSLIESISAFVSAGISAYPSATKRACSCVHALLHMPRFSVETETIRQSIAGSFVVAAFSRVRDIQKEQIKASGMWKPLLLAISSCYVLYPESTEQLLEKEEDRGFMIWAHALADVLTSSEADQSLESEIKLAVITLAKLVERLLRLSSDGSYEVLHKCFVSLIEATVHLKEVGEGEGASDEGIDEEEDDNEDEETDYDEDSEDDHCEETEDEFLDRYANVAADLEDGIIEESDSEDEGQEIQLGPFDEIDIQAAIMDLISRNHHVLLKGQTFPPDLITRFTDNFPQCRSFFQAC